MHVVYKPVRRGTTSPSPADHSSTRSQRQRRASTTGRLGAWVSCALFLALGGCAVRSDLSQYKTYKDLQKDAAVEEVQQPVSETTDPNEPTEPGELSAADHVANATITGADWPVSALAPLNVVDGTTISAVMNAAPPASTPPPNSNQAGTSTPTAISPLPGGIRLLIPEKTFKVEGPAGALRISYDDLDLLKVLNMDPVPPDADRYFPDWLRELHGKRIRIRGFMYPQFESTGIERFVLARDNQICCFGRDPKVYDLIEVEMARGKTTDYILGRPFDVVGIFHIQLIVEDGKPLGLYRVTDAIIIDR
ncbi:MAG: hypothetical protein KatS3mg113_0684 [Planctomycetaceae bacterium]|nr:MAG: hypothetical protein KatS3mg113_0684 [Planctomycetaceae bacterium]